MVRSIPFLALVATLSLFADPGMEERSFFSTVINLNPAGGRPFAQGLLPGLDRVGAGWHLSLGYGQTYDNLYQFYGKGHPENPCSSSHVFTVLMSFGKGPWEWGIQSRVFQDVPGHALSQMAETWHNLIGFGHLNRGVFQARIGESSVIDMNRNLFLPSFIPYAKYRWETPMGGFTAALSLKVPVTGLPWDTLGVALGASWRHFFSDGPIGVLLAGSVAGQVLAPPAFGVSERPIAVESMAWDFYVGLPMRFGPLFHMTVGQRMGSWRLFVPGAWASRGPVQVTELTLGLGPRSGEWDVTLTALEDLFNDYGNTESDFALHLRAVWRFHGDTSKVP